MQVIKHLLSRREISFHFSLPKALSWTLVIQGRLSSFLIKLCDSFRYILHRNNGIFLYVMRLRNSVIVGTSGNGTYEMTRF